jgi:hypothetical protein
MRENINIEVWVSFTEVRQTSPAHTVAVNSKALTEQRWSWWELRSESLLLQSCQNLNHLKVDENVPELLRKVEQENSDEICNSRELSLPFDWDWKEKQLSEWLNYSLYLLILCFRHSITPIIKYRYMGNVAQAIPVHSNGERLVGLNGNWTKTHGTFKNKIHKVNLI